MEQRAVEHRYTLEEYAELECTNENKYEYSDGHLYAMSGGTLGHNRIVVTMTTMLDIHLRGNVCRVFNSDTKVFPVKDNDKYQYYPDVTVTCNPEDSGDTITAIRHPRLIIEVLSPSTASKDRGEKLRAYQACASVEEYVMISTRRQEVEVYHREGEDEWKLTRYRHGQNIELKSIKLTLDMSEIYRNTDIPAIAEILPDQV